jgi:hypothetical protein
MEAERQEGTEAAPGGQPRRGDRRAADRRKSDRRTPVPPWRSTWALVAYGGVGMLLLVWLFSGLGDDGPAPVPDQGGDVVAAPAPAVQSAPSTTQAPNGPPQDALSTADFERLVLEADASRGRVVRAQLYCDQPDAIALVQDADTVEASVAALLDQERRVPAAECRWGRQDDARREDFLLLIPPALAGQFASAPVVMDGYIRRRRLIAHVEWIGESRALALRTAGIFRGLAPGGAPVPAAATTP